MKDFSYVARDISGNCQNGYSRALSKNDVLVWLRDQGLVPVEVRVLNPAKKLGSGFTRRHKVKSLEMASFCWQLEAMLEGGVSITSSLETIAEDCDNAYFQDIVRRVASNIENGESFTESVSQFPRVFNKLFCSIVMAGESGGSLATSMKRLAEYYDKKDKLARKIKGAIAYPSFVIGFIVLLLIFIMTFIIPRFKSLFEDIGGQLPVITRGLIVFCDVFKSNIIIISLLGTISVITAVLFCGRTEAGRRLFSRFVLKIPLIGKIISHGVIVIFSRNFATRLSAGVSVLDAFEIISSMSGNTVISSALIDARSRITEGASISLSMSISNFFPNLLVKMVEVGEESGLLTDTLDRTSNYYERKVETAIETVMTVLEPILIVAVGLIVLVVVLALYLPVFSLSNIKQ